jgi:M6 family metalloprotease-like protein
MEKIIYPQKKNSQIPEGISRVRSNNDAKVYSVGERYFPVVLVETSDFKALDSAFMYRMFNEEGFKENGNYGSVYDYFISSSGGKFKPTFDIYPVKLPDAFGNYKKEGSFITSALDVLVERSDFKSRASKYEKEIPFIFLHPTSKEKAASYNSGYFNHQYSLQGSIGRVYSKNGFKFNSYAFVSQKAENKPNATSTKDVAMLGAFIHEFSHVIGLVDTYSADANGYATIGPLPFDVMALGLRNGNGGYPPTFSAFEREAMGWLKLTELTNSDSVYELKNLSEMQAYAVSNPNSPNEYFIIEYRPAVGFDSKLGNSSYSGKQGKNGVLIWYIDYDARAFASNDPNSNQSHQRVEVRTVLSKNQESFTNFEFVNNIDKAAIEGIYNIVFDGDKRVCFTVNRSKSLDKCPENKTASSSSAATPISSSSAAVAKSSSSKANEPAEASSSSGKTALFAEPEASKVQMHTSHGMLNVEVPLAGSKTLRFYDALGNVIRTVSFEKSSVSIDVSGWNCSVYMQLDVNGKRLLAKQVKFR